MKVIWNAISCVVRSRINVHIMAYFLPSFLKSWLEFKAYEPHVSKLQTHLYMAPTGSCICLVMAVVLDSYILAYMYIIYGHNLQFHLTFSCSSWFAPFLLRASKTEELNVVEDEIFIVYPELQLECKHKLPTCILQTLVVLIPVLLGMHAQCVGVRQIANFCDPTLCVRKFNCEHPVVRKF